MPAAEPAAWHASSPWASLEALTEYRARVLTEGVTYDLAAVEPLDLPLLTEANRDAEREWHAYISHVYGEPPPLPLDLNTLGFFYWFAPIQLRRIYLCDWQDDYATAPYGTPWTGGLAAWAWGPEHLVRRLGFFVHRPRLPDAAYINASRLEVMRVGPLPPPGRQAHGYEERREEWFYSAVGSGVYLRTEGLLPLTVNFEEHMSVPRVELVGAVRQYAPPAEPWAEGGKESAADWWQPSVRYELRDGSACELTAQATEILTCANLRVPTWPLGDPRPTVCVQREGALKVRPTTIFCTAPSPPPAPPPAPPLAPPLAPPPLPPPPLPLLDGVAASMAAAMAVVGLLAVGGALCVRVWRRQTDRAAKRADRAAGRRGAAVGDGRVAQTHEVDMGELAVAHGHGQHGHG